MNGNSIIILKDGTAIAGAKTHDINTSAGTIETSSPNHGEWRTFEPERKEWSVSVSYLVLTAVGIRDVLQVGGVYTIIIRNRSNTSSLTGSAILTQCRQTYTRGNLVQGSFTFKGTGALS